MSELQGNRFLGLAWSSSSSQGRELDQARRLAATDAWRCAERPGLLLCSERAAFFQQSDAGALASAYRFVVESEARTSHTPASLSQRFRAGGPQLLRLLSAPLSLAWMPPGSDEIIGATDPFGVGQLFRAEANGVAAISNSAATLAQVFNREMHKEALVAFALFGAFPENDTPFDEIQKIPAGHLVRLTGGTARVEAYASFGHAWNARATSEDVAESIRQVMTELSDATPSAHLELSGGLDSRLMLAGLPPERRSTHWAVTVGPLDSPDVKIAEAIAARFALRHEVINSDDLPIPDGEELHELLQTVVEGYDYGANPFDKTALVLTNRSFPSEMRFSGQNGEILRGFFYPGQPLAAAPTPGLARGIIASRLETNELVSPRLFDGEVYGEARRAVEERAVARLLSFPGDWATVLDQFYLYERMQRWVGNSAGHFVDDRVRLYPFFDPRFVNAAFALAPNRKTNSKAAFEALTILDPALADIPLDSGLRPSMVVKAPARAKLAEGRFVAKKALSRIGRRFRKASRATLGSETLIQQWHDNRLYARLPGEALHGLGLFDPKSLDQVLCGEWLPDRPTLGYILMVSSWLGRT